MINKSQDNLSFNLRAFEKQVKESFEKTTKEASDAIQKSKAEGMAKMTVMHKFIDQNAYTDSHKEFMNGFLVTWPEFEAKMNLAVE